ncbi:MAG TPA: hypothetical protein V6C82_05030 [Chroococcales cyanobacterium]|jgi:REP element-mobilizing transposase RayT
MVEMLLESPAYLVELAAGSDFFFDTRLSETLLSEIEALRRRGDFLLHAFVLMPDSWRGIITPRQASVQTVLRRIRENTARCILPLLMQQKVWKKSKVKETIQEGFDLLMLAGQLHLEPLRAGLVEDPEDYPFSSLTLFHTVESEAV